MHTSTLESPTVQRSKYASAQTNLQLNLCAKTRCSCLHTHVTSFCSVLLWKTIQWPVWKEPGSFHTGFCSVAIIKSWSRAPGVYGN